MLTVPKSRVPGFFLFRRQLRLRHLRGRRRYLLGAVRVSSNISTAAARRLPNGVTPVLGPRRHRCRLGLPVRGHGQEPIVGRVRERSGLVCALRPVESRRASRKSRASAASVKQYNHRGRSPAAPDVRHSLVEVRDACGRATWTWAVAPSNYPNSSTWCEAADTSKACRIFRRSASKRGGHTGSAARRGLVELGPDERRGLTELNGEGEVASGIVLHVFGSNAST